MPLGCYLILDAYNGAMPGRVSKETSKPSCQELLDYRGVMHVGQPFVAAL